MLSMPPATTTSALPAASMSCANIIARMPLPHILLSVTAPADCGSPALRIAWRAGAWPWPAIRQLPISTSSMASPGTPARSTAALDGHGAQLPGRRATAKSPSRPPMGVRAAETMTMDSDMVCSCGGPSGRAGRSDRTGCDVQHRRVHIVQPAGDRRRCRGESACAGSYGNTSCTWPARMRSLWPCQKAASSRSAWCFMKTSRTAGLPSRKGPKVSGNTSFGPTRVPDLAATSPLPRCAARARGGSCSR